MSDSTALETAIVAVPETAGSALYGMVDVLSVTGNVWQTLTRTAPMAAPFRVRVVSVARNRFLLFAIVLALVLGGLFAALLKR